MASNEPTPPPSSLPAALRGRRGGIVTRGNSARLPSIRSPRDLTLGGSQKKTFAPNIPQRRDKVKQEVGDDHGERKHNKNVEGRRGSERGGRGRGRGRGRGEIIQSHSIFEDGPSERLKPKRGASDYMERERGGGGAGGSGGRVTVKRETSSAEADKLIGDLLRDDFISDLGGTTDSNMEPVTLPLIVKRELKEEASPKVKLENQVKKEPDIAVIEVTQDSPEAMEVISDETPSLPEKQASLVGVHTVQPPTSAAQLLAKVSKSEFGELMFFQLPDELPGEPSKASDDLPPHGRRQQQQQQQQQSQATEEKDALAGRLGMCSLEDFTDGHIGKLRVHKSGRTSLVLGNTTLDVTMGTPAGFLQEMACIQVNEDKTSADMTHIGQVQHKLLCIPNFDAMLDDVASSR